VCRPGHDPVEITQGELFRVEVDGEFRVTRMEDEWGEGYYSIDLYPLRGGMRANDMIWKQALRLFFSGNVRKYTRSS